MDKAPDLPIYQPGNAPGERVETLYYLPGDALQLFVRAVIAQESAPREPAQERQDGGAATAPSEAQALRKALAWLLLCLDDCEQSESSEGNVLLRFHADDWKRVEDAWEKADDALTAFAAPVGGADPLLPGLRARAARFRKALDAICARCKQEKDESPLADELYEIAALALATRDAEIARREGA